MWQLVLIDCLLSFLLQKYSPWLAVIFKKTLTHENMRIKLINLISGCCCCLLLSNYAKFLIPREL